MELKSRQLACCASRLAINIIVPVLILAALILPSNSSALAGGALAQSPDQLAYIRGGDDAKAGAAKRRIWIMNSDGSNKRQLTNDAAYPDERPLWSAEGNSLVFARLENATDSISPWTTPVAAGRPRELVPELNPLPPESTWFGYYGHIDWGSYFDLWSARSPAQLPETGGTFARPSTVGWGLLVVSGLALFISGASLVLLVSSP